MFPYPTDLPIDEMKELIATIKDGNLKNDRQNVGKNIWVIEGYILGRALGEPHPLGVMQAFHWPSLPVPPTKEILALLEQIIENPAVIDNLPVPLYTILKWLLSIALEMI